MTLTNTHDTPGGAPGDGYSERYEWAVRWHRARWVDRAHRVRVFQREAHARKFAAALRAGSPEHPAAEYVQVLRRPVGEWEPIGVGR